MILSEWLRNLLGTRSEIEARKFEGPVFITGCMRSGTTMLVNKITQHPQLLKVGGELNDIWTEIGGAPVYPMNEYRDSGNAGFIYANNMTSYFARSIEDAKSLKRHLTRYVYRWKTGGGRVFYDWPNVRVVNKSPHLINKTKYIHSLFPDSKIVFIIRPVHEQVASLKMHFKKKIESRSMPAAAKSGWSVPGTGDDLFVFPEDFKSLPLMWLRLNKTALEDLSCLPREAYTIVRYDDFITSQDSVLEKLFRFLKLDEKFLEEEKNIVRKNIKIFNTSTSGDPQRKWEKHLTNEEKEILNAVLIEFKEDYDFINKMVKSVE